MAVTLVASSGYQRGVASAETGGEISRYVQTMAPEWKEYRFSRTNEKIGFALAPVEAKISMELDVGGSTGVMALTFATAATIANYLSIFGAPTGGIYLDSAEVPQERAAWKTASLELSCNAGIA